MILLPIFTLWIWQTINYWNARRLDNEGVWVNSVVEGHCTREGVGYAPKNGSYDDDDDDSSVNSISTISHYIIYDLPGVGLVRQGVDKTIYDRVNDGSSIKLRYLPDSPRICRVEWEARV
ncbi:MAG: hypothetical protein JXR84_04045 [Anaerolineae bacterium]|nr:hypothetical protein [Anaerolineae bacterium]